MKVAALQCALGDGPEENVSRVVSLIERAAEAGAQVILPPELFEGPYFPRQEDERFFEWAAPAEGHPTLKRMSSLAKDLGVVIPFSFFERAGQAFYNSVACIDADGTNLGIYRKSHIPDGPGYEEKFYFRPGDTGFRVWNTRAGRLGVGICWDQWFPESARAMALLGAEVLLYPTAIGSEPVEPEDTQAPWQRCMVGHAVANAMPVVAANRVGTEGPQTFYGTSFICDHRGEILTQLDREETGFVLAELDLKRAEQYRAAWGFFRDRRPDLYGVLSSGDGRTKGT
ncbi:MAG: N-carbamoylputrescine amidase [Myxococcales bacterium]|nr:N-carbamoylputrescine amidase [Myxococcales bacterium]